MPNTYYTFNNYNFYYHCFLKYLEEISMEVVYDLWQNGVLFVVLSIWK